MHVVLLKEVKKNKVLHNSSPRTTNLPVKNIFVVLQ